MAQTKTRGSGKASSASTRSKSRTRKPQSSSRSRTTKQSKRKASTTKRKPSTTSKARKQSPRSSSNGNGLRDVTQTVEKAGRKVEKTGMKVIRDVGGAASKARTPLLAGSAALAGAAGGLAIGAMRSRHPGRKLMRKPLQGKHVKISPEDVAKTARRIGAVSQHVADLTGEMNGERRLNGRRKSPVEVVLEGLTSRR